MCISSEIRRELSFWITNIDAVNGRQMIPKSSSVGIIYSDVNVTGFGGFLVQCGQEFVSESWSVMEMNTSSTFREILAVKFVLLSCLIIFQAFMDQTPSMHPPPLPAIV